MNRPEEMTDEYTLYVLPLTAQNIVEAQKHRFYRFVMEKRYECVFVYDVEVAGGIEVTDQMRQSLTDADKQWLADCGYLMAEEYAKVHADKVEINSERLLMEWEKELAKERAKLQGKGGNA